MKIIKELLFVMVISTLSIITMMAIMKGIMNALDIHQPFTISEIVGGWVLTCIEVKLLKAEFKNYISEKD